MAHSHASVARQVVDFVLVFGAVDVNETVARVGVVFIQAIKPHPRRDQIPRGGIGSTNNRLIRPIYFE